MDHPCSPYCTGGGREFSVIRGVGAIAMCCTGMLGLGETDLDAGATKGTSDSDETTDWSAEVDR